MIHVPWIDHPLTEREVRDHFMLMLEDDTEDKPWMTMSDLQFWSASSLAHGLRIYARQEGLPWYVASMLPILYRWRTASARKQLSPDVFVAFAPDHARSTFDLDVETGFPPFVLEVVSPSSREHDEIDKRAAYEELGAREYVLFTPRADGHSLLEGYRRNEAGRLDPWLLDHRGRLWSDVLHLFFVADRANLRAETPNGRRLLTPEESEEAWRQSEQTREELEEAWHQSERARQVLEQARIQADEALQAAQTEIQRLRDELDRRNRT